MTKRFDEEVRVERDAGLPAAFEWRGRRYEVADVIGKWRIEGRWWADGRDREYWRVEARGGAVWDLYFDRQRDLLAHGTLVGLRRAAWPPPSPISTSAPASR